jgi:hypothetical protein
MPSAVLSMEAIAVALVVGELTDLPCTRVIT